MRRLFGLKLIALVMCALAFTTAAHADLIFTPQRIIIEPNERSATISVVNSSNSVKAYTFDWIHTRMNEYGEVNEVVTNVGGSASFVVFSPSRITLRPGETQTIRLAVRRPAGLPAGEYRSHLRLNAEDLSPPALLASNTGGQGMAAQVNIALGFTLPIIVRQGQGGANITATAVELRPQDAQVMVRFDRQGAFSTFGNVHLFWRPDSTSQLTPIGQLNGVAVYPEVSTITRPIPLFPDHGADLSRGELHVYYVDPNANNAVLSQTGVSL